MIRLLRVEDAFEITDAGTLVFPDFALPETGFTEQTIPVILIRPDRSRRNAEADLVVAHLRLSSGERSYRIQLRVRGLGKPELPIGTEILTESTVAHTLNLATE